MLSMGKPLMLRVEDDRRIERLKRRLRSRTKVDVVRTALDLLEAEADRREKIARWHRAAELARKSSMEFLRETERMRMDRLAGLD